MATPDPYSLSSVTYMKLLGSFPQGSLFLENSPCLLVSAPTLEPCHLHRGGSMGNTGLHLGIF